MSEQDNQQPSPEKRTCKKCGETKDLTEFAKVYCQKLRGRQYYQHTCLTCHAKYHREKARRERAAKPEHYRAYKKKWYHENNSRARAYCRVTNTKLRDEVFAAYGGAICKCCGETERSMLALDHINEDGTTHRKQIARERGWSVRTVVGTEMWRWARRNGYPPIFQVLCFNCNISKHRNKGVCAHQSGKAQRLSRKGVEPSGSKCTGPH